MQIFIFQRFTWQSALDIFLVSLVFFSILLLLRDTQAMVLLLGQTGCGRYRFDGAHIVDTRQIEGKKKVARRYLIPKGVEKSANIAANLLWGTVEYALGVDTRGKPD